MILEVPTLSPQVGEGKNHARRTRMHRLIAPVNFSYIGGEMGHFLSYQVPILSYHANPTTNQAKRYTPNKLQTKPSQAKRYTQTTISGCCREIECGGIVVTVELLRYTGWPVLGFWPFKIVPLDKPVSIQEQPDYPFLPTSVDDLQLSLGESNSPRNFG